MARLQSKFKYADETSALQKPRTGLSRAGWLEIAKNVCRA
jgi:hypothetical protein